MASDTLTLNSYLNYRCVDGKLIDFFLKIEFVNPNTLFGPHHTVGIGEMQGHKSQIKHTLWLDISFYVNITMLFNILCTLSSLVPYCLIKSFLVEN